MARSRSQSAPKQDRYLLREPLRVPTDGERHFRWLEEGSEVDEDELAGLAVAALETGGFIEKVAEAQTNCEACVAHGSQAEGKKKYTREELAAHYAKAHPGLALPEEG